MDHPKTQRPHLTGPELALELLATHPGIRAFLANPIHLAELAAAFGRYQSTP